MTTYEVKDGELVRLDDNFLSLQYSEAELIEQLVRGQFKIPVSPGFSGALDRCFVGYCRERLHTLATRSTDPKKRHNAAQIQIVVDRGLRAHHLRRVVRHSRDPLERRNAALELRNMKGSR